MPCVLWISCDCSSEELLKTIELQPYKIIEKGSVVETKDGEKHFEHTLCGFDVSTKDFTDFKTLVFESIEWLTANFDHLLKRSSLNTTEKLDFGFYTQFVDCKIVVQYDTIPWQLMKLASDLQMDIELSQYWFAENQGAQLN
ncbi:MAG TPA: hypothetical protein PL009_04920 [Flavipsychrobacter sp.]|nr:hypothetical protein [Flavipsychrobacter sp.]